MGSPDVFRVAVKRTAYRHIVIGSNIGSDCACSKSMNHILTAVKMCYQ